MFSLLHKHQKSPADSWARAQRQAAHREKYREWHQELPTGWLARFAEKGLRPFLASYGFDVSMSPKELVKWIAEWAFTHAWVQQNSKKRLPRTFLQGLNHCGEQEFDWFCHTIPTEDVMNFADKWQTDEFLDESDAGFAQRFDLLIFMWHIVNLETSRAYNEYINDTQEYGQNGDKDEDLPTAVTSEDTAFGGDRRTH
jgi:hypothetical protein